MYYPNPNNKDDTTPFSRIVLVVALSIVFFVIYIYLNPPKENPKPVKPIESSQQVAEEARKSTQDLGAPIDSNTPAISQPRALKDTIIAHVQSKNFELEIDALGRISQVYLKDERFTTDIQGSFFGFIGSLFSKGSAPMKKKLDKLPLFSTDSELKILEIRFANYEINNLSYNTAYRLGNAKVGEVQNIEMREGGVDILLSQDLGTYANSALKVQKIIHINEDLTYSLKVHVSNPNVEYFISNGMRPKADKDSYAFHGVVLKNVESKIEKIGDGDANNADFQKSQFVASVDRYYTSLFFTRDLANGLNVRIAPDSINNPMPFIHTYGNSELEGYIGPKIHKKLESIEANLSDVVEYGIITFFARWIFWLLDWLHGICANWGWSIVLLTFIVRIILFPLTYKGMVSMQKLKDIAPKMKEIQNRYKGDPQKMQVHMMDLYKKHGANPLGGCLPLLLQIPVFFAIYRVLYNAIELKNSAWILWIEDLSAIDPFFVLPVLMGVSMYISQRMTPISSTDKMQEKVFRMMPWFFMVFFIIFPFPAGLMLYWTINNIFSIAQQFLINKIMKTRKNQESKK